MSSPTSRCVEIRQLFRLAALPPLYVLPGRPFAPSFFRCLSTSSPPAIRPSRGPSAAIVVSHTRHSPHRTVISPQGATNCHLPSFPPHSFTQRHSIASLCARLVLSSILGLGFLTGVILLHDAFAYSERHVDRVPTNALALQPRRGGIKNLPILEVNLDEEEDEVKRAMKGKPRLVIVGGGWGVSGLNDPQPYLYPAYRSN